LLKSDLISSLWPKTSSSTLARVAPESESPVIQVERGPFLTKVTDDESSVPETVSSFTNEDAAMAGIAQGSAQTIEAHITDSPMADAEIPGAETADPQAVDAAVIAQVTHETTSLHLTDEEDLPVCG
jgi:hypothetical protein